MEMIFELGPTYKVTFENESALSFKVLGGENLTYEVTDENGKHDFITGSQWMNGFIKIEKVTGTQC